MDTKKRSNRTRHTWSLVGLLGATLGVLGGAGVGCELGDPCKDPTPLSELWEGGEPEIGECKGGGFVRMSSAQCAPQDSVDRCEVEGDMTCQTGADCPGAMVCTNDSAFWGTPDGCGCYESCLSDADCPDGTLCMCGSKGSAQGGAVATSNRCVPAECRTDADCPGVQAHCAMMPFGDPTPGFYCRDASDDCRGNADCSQGEICLYDRNASKWRCRVAMD